MSLQSNRQISFSDINKNFQVTGGNMGIGTTTPAHTLDVNGGIRSTNFTTTNALVTNTSSGTLNLSTGITSASAQITNSNVTTETIGTARITSALLAIGNSNTVGNIFTTGGNVGIATSNPSYKLHVVGDINYTGSLYQNGSIFSGSSQWLNSGSNIYLSTGNVGIGTASPSVKLHVVGGDIGLSYGQCIRINPGSDWPNGTTKMIETGWGINGMASDVLSIYTPGSASSTSRINLSSNGTINLNGNVGIGTASPGYNLDVNGSGGFKGNMYVNYAGSGGTPQVNVSPNTNAAESSIGFWQNTNNGGALWVVGHNPGGAGSNKFGIYSSTLAANVLVMNSSGYVGIGTASPSNRLQVYGGRIGIDDPNNAVLELKTNSYYSYIFTNASGNLEMYPGSSSNHIYLQPVGGKVAVGTASSNTPACPLHVKGAGGGGTIRTYPSTYNSESSIGFYSGESSGSYWVAGKGSWSAGDGLGIGYSAYGSVMTLGTNGGVGIRTSPSYPLHVNGSINRDFLYSYYAYQVTWYSIGYGAGNVPISIFASDRVAASEFNAFSDSRIKTNVQDVVDSSALETIRQIEPKRYKYIDTLKRTNETVWGFIAQQVGSVLDNSTGKITDFVPNIFDKVSVSELDGDTLLTSQNRISVEFDISDNATRRIRLHTQDDTEVFVTLKTVVSSNSFTVEETLSESSYFAYGQEVKDFHTLNKDAIFTVAVAALQEVDRQLQQERQKVSNLETEFSTLQQQYQDLLARIINLESN